MPKIHYSHDAEEAIGRYFENYQGSPLHNDMWERALHLSKIIACLSHLNVYVDETFVIDGKNYIEVDGICTIEFEVKDKLNEIVIMNIYFKNQL